MKSLQYFIILLSLFCGRNATAAGTRVYDSLPANAADVRTVDGIIAALYDVISGPAGAKRNWDRMRTLFLPGARLIATAHRSDTNYARRVMTVEEYIASSGPVLEQNGFFETELSRKTEQYGGIVHVFSTYESRRKKEEEKPFMRGINSIQLLNDGKRWWIVNILWQNESEGSPIPGKYLE